MALIIEAQKGVALLLAMGFEGHRLGAIHVRHKAAEEDNTRSIPFCFVVGNGCAIVACEDFWSICHCVPYWYGGK